ncbi:hypothetical protein ASPZODRAFT_127000 [Penicilliopsis zonata CBS 506.65]|uniref:RING-type domain-containing protein n=1 Tax=Penicilliopsis zonata CBS 506.65 TaxID=1073090 RepID=A0A1L9SUY6_9EURO|nr:hypothetical protein ASPZODRAFT_127000 [Penicilliopsis zonata CBS 506.65]OJJ51008.1 hypothetical protein ASPZODRAFT_127000 [Penicilliopsis zonata CBS 506.65]
MDRRTSIVDLTSTSGRSYLPHQSTSAAVPSPSSSGTTHRRPSQGNTETRSVKRRRLSRIYAPTEQEEEEIESVDLTEVEDASAMAKALAKQQKDAVKAQQQQDQEHEKGRTVLTAYKCPVCMDTLENSTSTICGHLFCHKCIIDTLKFGEEQRSDSSSKARGTCPVCRKPLLRTDVPGTRRNLWPLQLKLVTKKRSELSSQ